MKPDVRAQLVAAWEPRVIRLSGTRDAVDLSTPQGVSVLVLSVLASRFHTPLQPELIALIVQQLISLLEHPSDLHRLAAAELLSKGVRWPVHTPALVHAVTPVHQAINAHALMLDGAVITA